MPYENGIKMIANSPTDSNTLLNGHALDVHQYENPWQNFNAMAFPEDSHEAFASSHPEFMHLT